MQTEIQLCLTDSATSRRAEYTKKRLEGKSFLGLAVELRPVADKESVFAGSLEVWVGTNMSIDKDGLLSVVLWHLTDPLP